MARSGRSSSFVGRERRTDDVSYISSRRLVPRLELRPFEDRRLFHPLQVFRPALTFTRRASARVVLSRPQGRPFSSFSSPDVLRFAVPRDVVMCVRRQDRREVLFAKRLMRSGGGSKKHRNYWSAISCRR